MVVFLYLRSLPFLSTPHKINLSLSLTILYSFYGLLKSSKVWLAHKRLSPPSSKFLKGYLNLNKDNKLPEKNPCPNGFANLTCKSPEKLFSFAHNGLNKLYLVHSAF